MLYQLSYTPKMGRLVGLEPTNAGATIQCVNHFTTAAISMPPHLRWHVRTSSFLSSQVVSNQVLSTYECLTTVFGMGTGGTTQLSPLDFFVEVAVNVSQSRYAFSLRSWDVFAYDLLPNRLRLLDRSAYPQNYTEDLTEHFR